MYVRLKWFCFLILILCSVQVDAQKHLILDKLELRSQSNVVVIDLIISLGFTCNGINIYRSDNIDQPQLIGRIPGICGSNDSPTSYSFIDEQPIQNKKSYYWVEPGGYDLSEPVSLTFIDFQSRSYLLFPHPVITESQLFFQNDLAELLRFRLYNLDGRIMMEQETRGNQLTIRGNQHPSGLYLFVISNASGKVFHKGTVFFR